MSEESKLEASGGKGKGKAKREERELNNISGALVEQLLKANPSLAGEMQGMEPKKVEEMMRGMNLQDILTGMVCCFHNGFEKGVIADRSLCWRSLPGARIRRTWLLTSFGIRSRFRSLVCFPTAFFNGGNLGC